jgi:hypothetical protein
VDVAVAAPVMGIAGLAVWVAAGRGAVVGACVLHAEMIKMANKLITMRAGGVPRGRWVVFINKDLPKRIVYLFD